MVPKAFYISLIISIIFLSTTALINAVDIVYFLEKYPEFKTFSDLINKTKVADNINRQGTVTVLLLDNGEMGSITGLPENKQTAVLETHVILDYYDEPKLKRMVNKTANATNLYQKTGQAQGGQGSTHITTTGTDTFFSSAEQGAPQNSKMVKVVNSKPSSFSAIQIDQAIVTPGIGSSSQVGSPPTPSGTPTASPPTPAAGPPPPMTNNEKAPAPAADSKDAESPSKDSDSSSDDAPPEPTTAESENGALEPAASEPAASGPAPAPDGEEEEADTETPAKLKDSNGAVKLTTLGGVIVGLMGLATLAQ